MNTRRGPLACVVLTLTTLGVGWQAGVIAGQAPAQPAPAQDAKAEAALAQDAAMLQKLVDSAGATTSAVPVTWVSNHFLRSAGTSVYVPFTVAVDRTKLTSASLVLYVRAVSKAAAAPAPAAPAAGAAATPARPTYAWEQAYSVDQMPTDGQLSRAMALSAGTYDVFVAVKPKNTPETDMATVGVVRKEIVVPAFSDTELATSSVILLRGAEQLSAPLPANQQPENPYVINVLKLTPSIDGVFAKSGELDLIFWIYGASQTGGKPDVQIDYNFHTRSADGSSKYFNKTKPQMLNAQALPPEFNLTAGHQLIGNLKIPLMVFPAGDYRVEIKVTDLPSGKSVTQNVNFTVSA
jgi:hypothetical protein